MNERFRMQGLKGNRWTGLILFDKGTVAKHRSPSLSDPLAKGGLSARCGKCNGSGVERSYRVGGDFGRYVDVACEYCGGSGRLTSAQEDEWHARYTCLVFSVAEDEPFLKPGDIVSVPYAHFVMPSVMGLAPAFFTDSRYSWERAMGAPFADIGLWSGDGFTGTRMKPGVVFLDADAVPLKVGASIEQQEPAGRVAPRDVSAPSLKIDPTDGNAIVSIPPMDVRKDSIIEVPQDIDFNLSEQEKTFAAHVRVRTECLFGVVVASRIEGLSVGDWVLTQKRPEGYDLDSGGRIAFVNRTSILAKGTRYAD